MELKSLTYTSLARLDLTAADIASIHETARHLNALDGITGLLVFNGSRFLQVIEGAEEAIDNLVARLRRDARHSGLEVRDERLVSERSFPDWSMELVTVSAGEREARDEIGSVLPASMPLPLRALVLDMAQSIAPPLRMPD
jgi:hypothetical protein